MNKLKLNYVIDFLLLISFLVTGFSGIAIVRFLPGGIPQAGQQLFFGVTRHNWLGIHKLAGIIMIILVFVHLILHWQWISQVTKNLFKCEQQQNNHKKIRHKGCL